MMEFVKVAEFVHIVNMDMHLAPEWKVEDECLCGIVEDENWKTVFYGQFDLSEICPKCLHLEIKRRNITVIAEPIKLKNYPKISIYVVCVED